MEYFTGEETGLGWDSILLAQVGLCLYNVEINADQGEMAGIEVEKRLDQGELGCKRLSAYAPLGAPAARYAHVPLSHLRQSSTFNNGYFP